MGLFSFLTRKRSTGVFIPTLEGFQEYTGLILGNGSARSVAESLGYHPDQIQMYYGFGDERKSSIYCIGFEVFSDNVAFVLTKDTVKELKKRHVNRYLKRFDLADFYDSYTVENILEEGVNNQSLSTDFLTKVLLIRNSNDNGCFYIESIGHYLLFNGGYLSAYVPSDGLNKWAKGWKERNPKLLNKYVEDARKVLSVGQFKMIEWEVNAQAEAFANIPGGWQNEFIKYHRNPTGTVNFVMLRVCHYAEPITLEDFSEINYGRYIQISSNPSQYSLGSFFYTFNSDGILVDITFGD